MANQVPEGAPTYLAPSRDAWRQWLETHCRTDRQIWLEIPKSSGPVDSVRFHDAIEDALCFGWVDSKAVRRNGGGCFLCFSPRNPKSTWGRVNRQRAERLIATGLMRPPGQEVIDEAKRTGTWDRLAEAQEGIVPPDLAELFESHPRARANFDRFPISSRRLILEWIVSAKRPETRARRMSETVESAARNVRAHH